jgi:hypothetical protein
MFAELAQNLFSDSLSKYTSSVLSRVSEDYSLDFQELSERYLTSEEGLAFFTPIKPEVHVNLGEKKVRRKREKSDTPKAPKKLCTGLTSKGTPCTFAAAPDNELCGIHLRKLEGGAKNEKLPKEPKEPKKVKKVKVAPVHNHPLTEENTDGCELCETHGNIVAPNMSIKEFEAVTSDGVNIRDKLKAILALETDEQADELTPEKPEEKPEISAEKDEIAEKEAAYRLKVKRIMEAQNTEEEEEKPKPKPKSFIRPKMKKSAPEPKPADVAGPSKSKLESVITWEDETAAAKFEAHNEEDIRERLARAMNSEDVSDEETDLEQLCDTPSSADKLRSAFSGLNMDEEESDEELQELQEEEEEEEE